MDEKNKIENAGIFDTDNQNDIGNGEIFGRESESEPCIIKALGVGGGGGNAVNYMYTKNIKSVSFALCNTDSTALRLSPVPNQLVMGYEITHGLGAGNDPEIGRQCAEASADEIRKLLSDGTEMVFITAGMGGGTGTGAAPVIAKIAKEADILTIGIVTIPFLFEGDAKIIAAMDGAEKMSEYVDALLLINNQRLTEIYPDLEFENAFDKSNDTLANAAMSISEIITEPGIINVDFRDVKSTLKDAHSAIIATGYGEGENRVTKAIQDAINSPLLKNSDINSSKRLLFKLSYNPNMEERFKMSEMNELTEFTNNLPRTIKMKWGYSKNPDLGEKVKMTILAAGFEMTTLSEKKSKKKDKEIIFGTKPVQKPEEPIVDPEVAERMREVYGKETIKKHGQAKAKVKYVVLRPDQFDDDEAIRKIELNPAYNRNPAIKDELKQTARLRNHEPEQRHDADTKTHPMSGEAPIMFDE